MPSPSACGSTPTTTPTGCAARAPTATTAGAGGTVRTIDGELKVKALLVAGTVERAIVAGLQEHLDEEGQAVEAYLSERGLRAPVRSPR